MGKKNLHPRTNTESPAWNHSHSCPESPKKVRISRWRCNTKRLPEEVSKVLLPVFFRRKEFYFFVDVADAGRRISEEPSFGAIHCPNFLPPLPLPNDPVSAI
ncbi:hypothetical protein LEP1GSC052_0140 [Leptospira kmetyi serovar Malaysia str. Bejo-Iso9]|nr:hypothetical protein LEP1GSC052_0140 [Leptospira kmetyi serovar Malaysia str. Bejo-Iso9]